MSVAGLVVLAVLCAVADVSEVFRAPAEMWWLLGLLLVAELVPVRIPRRNEKENEKEEVTTSTIVAFALLLRYGIGIAVLAQAVASVASDLLRRKQWWKTTFNAAQYVLALAPAGLVLQAVSGPWGKGNVGIGLAALLGVFAAGAVYVLINHILVGLALALVARVPLLPQLAQDLRFGAVTSGILLALSPVVLVVADRSLWLLPFLLLPMAAIYKSASVSVEKEYEAFHDPLTNLPNRRLLMLRLEQAISDARRSRSSVCVLLLDLHRFKEINDTIGHQAGDLLLLEMARLLAVGLPQADTVARLGGDEFAIVLIDEDGAGGGARQVLELLQGPVEVADVTFDVEVSIGLSSFPRDGDDPETLMQRADVAMYVAKGRHSGCESYDPAIDPYSPQRLNLIGDLRRAVRDRSFDVVFQPKVDMRSNKVTGTEALLRWHRPGHGPVPPEEFIPAAEHSGLIGPLTQFVLEESLRQCRRWRDIGFPIPVSVNVSLRSLYDLDFYYQVACLLEAADLPGSSLEVEITESTVMADPDRSLVVLNRLHALGVTFALDDFGTGYSSLAHLKRLPVTALKIDRNFVAGMVEDENDEVIVRSTIELAHGLGLEAVAEGVESAEVWRRLARLGCDVAQGYFVERPLDAVALQAWLQLPGQRAGARI